MKAKKPKPLTSQRTGKQRKPSTRRQRKTTAVTRTTTKKKPAKKQVIAKPKSAKKIAPKAKIIPLRQYYITVSGEKVPLDNELIRKYNLKAGDILPFSGHKIFVEK